MAFEKMKTTLDKIIGHCREQGLRRTRALSDLLQEMLRQDRPVTLNDLTESKLLRGHYDNVTIYRLLTRLEEKGVVKQLGFHRRAAYYILKETDRHRDYLVCSRCGSIESLDIACPVHALESQIEKESGFKNLEHELKFFGLCPDCESLF